MTFTFKPLTREDLPMLHEWLHRPHVRRWWREPSTIAELEHDYVQPSADPSTRAYTTVRDDTPVGFIQSYVVRGSGGGWWTSETDPGTRGIDQVLANASELGQGLSRAMIGDVDTPDGRATLMRIERGMR